jgi:hypothetical protein
MAERALGGGMLKSMLAASLAAKGGNVGGQPETRFASAISVAADAVRQAAPALAADGRQAVAATMQSLLDQARAVMASRPDLAAGAPGNGSGGTAPAVDLRDWDTRKADDARDSFLVTALRLLTDACFNVASAGALGTSSTLPDLATNLAVHLDRLKPELAAPGPNPAGGNASAAATAFPAFVHSLRDLAGQIRK